MKKRPKQGHYKVRLPVEKTAWEFTKSGFATVGTFGSLENAQKCMKDLTALGFSPLISWKENKK